MNTFSPTTLAHLGYYVYALIDPTNNKIFYVGQGQNNRVFDHAHAALNPSIVTPSHKLQTIRKIIKSGKDVEFLILRHGLKDKHEATIVESVLIDLLTNPLTKSQRINPKMTNIQGGHYMRELGIRKARDLEAQYGSVPIGQSSHRLVVININRTYKDPSKTIYEATQGTWRLSKKRADKADYVLSEYQGVIRAVFKMDEKKWQPLVTTGKTKVRYYFTGTEVKDPIVLSAYINKSIPKKKGTSNPIRYINM